MVVVNDGVSTLPGQAGWWWHAALRFAVPAAHIGTATANHSGAFADYSFPIPGAGGGAAWGVTRIVDVTGGSSAALSNDATGRMTKITASNGATAAFISNPRGQTAQATMPSGTVSHLYHARSLPTEIRFSDRRWVRYRDSPAHRLLEIADSTGTVERIAGVQPAWFQHERTAQAAVLCLRRRGGR